MVFVHGLGGDHAATWRYDQNSSWPHWLAAEFPEVGVWSLEYAASPTKLARFLGIFSGDRDAGYSMALPDRAGQVLDRMVQKHLGERPLFFICHSLGGLLVKQILRKADDADDDPRKKLVAAQTRAVLFLATPHNGAELASLLDAFRTLFGTTVSIEDLRAHDAHLLDLYNWYRNHSLGLGIRTVTYYEKRPVMGVLPIVNATSSQAGVGPDAVPLDEDHLSIAKPRDRDEQVCDAARELLNDYVLVSRSATPKQPQLAPVVVAAASEPQRVIVQLQSPSAGSTVRIPCELPPKAKTHFGRLTELEQLTDLLLAGDNCAVVGPAGMGKTALAAQAVRAIVGETAATLAASPFPDGVVFLDLYAYQGKAEPAWNTLANALAGPGFMESSSAQERATEACRSRRALIIIEGGEEADGQDGRTTIPELSRGFSLENHCLLLTRLSTQADPAASVELKEALHPDDAGKLLDSLSKHRLTGAVREQVLALLEGHPLALTWAGGLLARDDDDPEQLVKEWEAGPGSLSDPIKAEHTLAWLFERSVRGLDETERQLLQAAGLLARAPFPLAAMHAVLDSAVESARDALKSLVQRGLLRRSEEPGHWEFTHVLGYRFARKETGSDAALREHLGVWLNRHLHAVIADTASQHEVAMTRALEHIAALLRADDGQKLWLPLANDLLYDNCDRLRALGRLDLVGLALSGAGDWLALLPALTAQEPDWLRERSVLLERRADVLSDQGDLDGALTAHRESLVLSQRLAQTDPSNDDWQRDLSVSHNKVGDVLRYQGDLDAALAAYRESLVLRSRLALADPTNERRQRDLGVSHERIGGVLRAQGDLDGALTAYRESLALRRPLALADPSNAGWQRDLSVSHAMVGDVLFDQGDLDGALKAYQESLALRRPLALGDPSNAVWQRNLSVNHDNIGDVLLNQGDLDGALTAYRESLSIIRRLAQTDPSNAGWQRDLSFTLNRLAILHDRQGDLLEAVPLAEESLEINERLAALDRTNVLWQKDVAVGRGLVARLRDESSSR